MSTSKPRRRNFTAKKKYANSSTGHRQPLHTHAVGIQLSCKEALSSCSHQRPVQAAHMQPHTSRPALLDAAFGSAGQCLS
ncbi:hypothetical protein SCLCIDRAFT_1222633 [Scleroderma citrinum Foug A]|uniref:Uncharacterized protein n=1 Tax=Scleroderma citrinum Foug A TaxID=1036808 RepID=A0A0C3CYN7_9AGAM|nr:hypothetical protein SCLCIDRAFT_1222633 [Scleroderma citrinum Foug A]